MSQIRTYVALALAGVLAVSCTTDPDPPTSSPSDTHSEGDTPPRDSGESPVTDSDGTTDTADSDVAPALPGTLRGNVSDASNEPIPGAVVTVGTQSTTTDDLGAFELPGLAPADAVAVSVRADGYTRSVQLAHIEPAGETSLPFTLLAVATSSMPDPEQPAAVQTPSGGSITFPGGGFSSAAGSPVTGPVEISYAVVSAPEEVAAAPGGLRLAPSAPGAAAPRINTLGLVEVNLSQGGQPVAFQGAATISLPLPANATVSDGDNVSLYSFNESTGYWVEEGVATVVDGAVVGEVDHFSWWTFGTLALDAGCISGRLRDHQGLPLAGFGLQLVGVDHLAAATTVTASDGTFCIDGDRNATSRLSGSRTLANGALHWQAVVTTDDTPGACGGAGSCTDLGDQTAAFISSACVTGVLPNSVNGHALQWRMRRDLSNGTSQSSNMAPRPSGFCLNLPISTETLTFTPESTTLGCGPNMPFDLDGTPADCAIGGCQPLGSITPNASQFTPHFVWYRDADGDGFGTYEIRTCTPQQPPGTALIGGDCNDTNPYVFPGAPEVCGNGVDNSCDGVVPDCNDDCPTYASTCPSPIDSDVPPPDTDVQVDPDSDAPIDTDTHVDPDTDLLPDTDDPAPPDPLQVHVTITPSAPSEADALLCDVEVTHPPADGIDFTFRWVVDGTVLPFSAPTLPADYTVAGSMVFCEAETALHGAIVSWASETVWITHDAAPCPIGMAPDCDGVCFDEAALTTYVGDGACDDGTIGPNLLCAAWSFDDGDCDVMAPTCDDGIHNGDESDVDCGGASCPPCPDDSACGAHADCASGYCSDLARCASPDDSELPAGHCYVDGDGDGYGSDDTIASPSAPFCDADGVAPVSGDCDDFDPNVHPDATEIPADGIDSNCDGFEDCYVDGDLDTWGSDDLVQSTDFSCTSPGTANRDGDCDDANPLAYPSAPEICGNGVDNSCDGLTPGCQDTCPSYAAHCGTGGDAVIQLSAGFGSVSSGASGGSAGSIIALVTIDGASVSTEDVLLTLVSHGGLWGLAIDSQGVLIAPPNTTAGTYEATVQACEAAAPANCASAIYAITVGPGSLSAHQAHPLTVADGGSGGQTTSILGGIAIDGASVLAHQVALSIADDGGITGLHVSTDGALQVPGGTPPGDYGITVQICESLNPTNCIYTVYGIDIGDGDGEPDTDPIDTDSTSPTCPTRYAPDCDGDCHHDSAFSTRLGDGHCHDGSDGGPNLDCPAFEFDFGDCMIVDDCQGQPYPEMELLFRRGDGRCDSLASGMDLNCAAHNFDNGDCRSTASTSAIDDCTEWTLGAGWACGQPTSGPNGTHHGGHTLATNLDGDHAPGLRLASAHATRLTTLPNSHEVLVQLHVWAALDAHGWNGYRVEVSTDGVAFHVAPPRMSSFDWAPRPDEGDIDGDTDPDGDGDGDGDTGSAEPPTPPADYEANAWRGGTHGFWVTRTADLSAWAGQAVHLRVAFTSVAGPTHAGVYIDAIDILHTPSGDLTCAGQALDPAVDPVRIADGVCDQDLNCHNFSHDGGDCELGGTPCRHGGVVDCVGSCSDEALLGDGTCNPWFACDDLDFDDGDCVSHPGCPPGYIEDCWGDCAPTHPLGDGICDEPFDCVMHDFDHGDCENDVLPECEPGEIADCWGGCSPEAFLGDGECDAFFDCPLRNHDGGDCSHTSPTCDPFSEVPDCDGTCIPSSPFFGTLFLGDGFCHDGGPDSDGVNFNCAAYSYDEGDCVAPPSSCDNGLHDGDETDVDCGGPSCPPCYDGSTCQSDADCADSLCVEGLCGADDPGGCPHGTISDCHDGCTDFDLLGDGGCDEPLNCAALNYDEGDCVAPPPPSCSDGIHNGNESDVDCGGPDCESCPDGAACWTSADCLSGACGAGTCDSTDAPCPTGYLLDCDGGCSPEAWLGDGECDEAFNCMILDFDLGDCESIALLQVVIVPDSPAPGEPTTCSAEVQAPPDALYNVWFEWYVGGGIVASDTDVYTPTSSDAGQRLDCFAYVDDGTGLMSDMAFTYVVELPPLPGGDTDDVGGGDTDGDVGGDTDGDVVPDTDEVEIIDTDEVEIIDTDSIDPPPDPTYNPDDFALMVTPTVASPGTTVSCALWYLPFGSPVPPDSASISWSSGAVGETYVVQPQDTSPLMCIAELFDHDGQLLDVFDTPVFIESDPTACAVGEAEDCEGTCYDEGNIATSIGDGVCDDGSQGGPHLYCAAFSYDGGDCDPGLDTDAESEPDTDAEPEPDTDAEPVLEPSHSSVLGVLHPIPAGSFTMGCEGSRDDIYGGCGPSETPTQHVTLTRGTWVMVKPFTEEMAMIIGLSPPMAPCGPDCPMVRMNWWDALYIANEASMWEGLPTCYDLFGCSGVPGETFACSDAAPVDPSPYDCEGYRLPTEAEWEYAARAGEPYAHAGSNDVDTVAWHSGNAGGLSPACNKLPNAWGLCDMNGNASEWVWDGFNPYSGGAVIDPHHTPSSQATSRGGSYQTSPPQARNASRQGRPTGERRDDRGFRLVRTATP